MDIWAQLWPIPYKDGKVHKSVVRYISWQVTSITTMEAIYREVVKSGISDDADILATSRALWAIRDNLRKMVQGERKVLVG